MVEGIVAAGLPADAVQLVPTTDRAAVGALLKAAEFIDLIVPRGGKNLVARVQEEARVPVQIGRAHVCTPVTNAHLVCRLLLEQKSRKQLQMHTSSLSDVDIVAHVRIILTTP